MSFQIASGRPKVSVTVFCDHSSHSGLRWERRYERPAGEAGARWLEIAPPASDGQRPREGADKIRRAVASYMTRPRATQFLTGDDKDSGQPLMPWVEYAGESEADLKVVSQGRQRHNLRCGYCHETVPGREEKLFPIFDTLAAHEVPEISLSALRNRLSAKRC